MADSPLNRGFATDLFARPEPHQLSADLAADDRITVREPEAVRLTGLSGKTLKRIADRGEPVGRFTQGRVVLFHLPTLRAWMATHATGGRPNVGEVTT